MRSKTPSSSKADSGGIEVKCRRLPGITRCGIVPPHLVVHLRNEKTDNAVLPYSVECPVSMILVEHETRSEFRRGLCPRRWRVRMRRYKVSVGSLARRHECSFEIPIVKDVYVVLQ